MWVFYGICVLCMAAWAQDVGDIVQLEVEIFQDSRALNELPSSDLIRDPRAYSCGSSLNCYLERHFSHEM